jgi:cytochrome bd ubiquinol oxidase subunit II
LETLQILWLLLVGVLLMGYAILDGFDLGAGILYLFSKKEEEKKAILKSIGPFWDGNEVWLLTGGGALFAAFPAVYAATFSGFYLAMMLVLFGLIFRAVSIEFRNQLDSDLWKKIFDKGFVIGSFLPALLYGVAVGNVVRGLPMDADYNYTGTFFDLLNPYSLGVGLNGLFMFITHGAIFLAMRTEGELRDKAKKWAQISYWPYLILFVGVSLWSFISYHRGPFVLSPWVNVTALLGMITLRVLINLNQFGRAFLCSCAVIMCIMLTVGIGLYPYLVPPLFEGGVGLTIFNSSSFNTLMAMLVIAIVGMPIVIAYHIYIYKLFLGEKIK